MSSMAFTSPNSSTGSPRPILKLYRKPLTPSSDEEDDDLPSASDEYGTENFRMRDLSREIRGHVKQDIQDEEGEGEEEEEEEEGNASGEERGFLSRDAAGSRRSSVESFELYTPEEDRQVLHKLDKSVVWFVALLYMLGFLDRSNIGNAKIAGLEHDLHLTSSQYEWLLTAFYITYISFEWMTLLYRIIPPHIYTSVCVLTWGLIASVQSVVQSFIVLFVLRALLGIGEAAFSPGIPFYLSFFYRRSELAFRTGLFISAAPLSASFAGSLAWAITKFGQNGPIAPWRLLFLVEGFPSVIAAIVAWDKIPDSPETARFLNDREKVVALLRLRREKENFQDEDLKEIELKYMVEEGNRRTVKLREILQTLMDLKSYLTAMMFFGCNVAFSSMPVFLPTIIREMGYTSLTAQALSAPPYLVSFIAVLLVAYLSDRQRSRSAYLIFVSLLSALGYALIAIASYLQLQPLFRYIPIYLACAGFFSAITLIITWTLNNQETSTAKGTGIALLNMIGQCGPLVGIRLYPDIDAPWYVRGMETCAGCMIIVAFLALWLRLVLHRENRKRARDYEIRRRRSDDGIVKQPFLFIL